MKGYSQFYPGQSSLTPVNKQVSKTPTIRLLPNSVNFSHPGFFQKRAFVKFQNP